MLLEYLNELYNSQYFAGTWKKRRGFAISGKGGGKFWPGLGQDRLEKNTRVLVILTEMPFFGWKPPDDSSCSRWSGSVSLLLSKTHPVRACQ